jgi:hypothetical protein
MAAERQKQLALAVLLVALAGVIYWQMRPDTAVPAAAPSNRRAGRPPAAGTGAADVPDVRLEALNQQRTKPGGATRNLFRYKPPPAPPPPPPMPPPPAAAQRPPPMAAAQTIPLRLIGIVSDDKGKIAALADDRDVYHGREGTIIEGRYRVVQIGEESVVVEHVDGHGRQTLPMSNRGR